MVAHMHTGDKFIYRFMSMYCAGVNAIYIYA